MIHSSSFLYNWLYRVFSFHLSFIIFLIVQYCKSWSKLQKRTNDFKKMVNRERVFDFSEGEFTLLRNVFSFHSLFLTQCQCQCQCELILSFNMSIHPSNKFDTSCVVLFSPRILTNHALINTFKNDTKNFTIFRIENSFSSLKNAIRKCYF